MFDYFLIPILLFVLLIIKLAQRRNHTTIFGAPFVPLEPEVVNRIMELANVKPGDILYDLGSGDGRLVIAAATQGAKATGIEIDLFRVLYSRFCILLFGLNKNAKILHQDIFKTDLSNATVVTIYLLQETNDLLFEKLRKELKPGTRIVSAAFNFPKWKADSIDPRGPIYGPLYLYEIKAN